MNKEMLVMVITGAFATVGLIEVIKKFHKFSHKWIYSILTVLIGFAMYWVQVALPPFVIGGILIVVASLMFYDAIWIKFKKTLDIKDITKVTEDE